MSVADTQCAFLLMPTIYNPTIYNPTICQTVLRLLRCLADAAAFFVGGVFAYGSRGTFHFHSFQKSESF